MRRLGDRRTRNPPRRLRSEQRPGASRPHRSVATGADRLRSRFLCSTAALTGWHPSGVVDLGSPRHAVGCHEPLARPGNAGRRVGISNRGRRRQGRVDLAAGVVARRRPSLCVRPQRLVESVPPDRKEGRTGLPRRCRVRRSALDIREQALRLPRRRPHRGDPGHAHR